MNKGEFHLALHQKLVETADLLLYYYNPCLMEHGGASCLRGEPIPCCSNRTRFKRDDPDDLKCRFLGLNGCEFINIECKIWLCEEAQEQAAPLLRFALGQLFEIAKAFGLTNER